MEVSDKMKEHKMEVSLDKNEAVSDWYCGMNCYLYISS